VGQTGGQPFKGVRAVVVAAAECGEGSTSGREIWREGLCLSGVFLLAQSSWPGLQYSPSLVGQSFLGGQGSHEDEARNQAFNRFCESFWKLLF
jgi:hypothetical protein